MLNSTQGKVVVRALVLCGLLSVGGLASACASPDLGSDAERQAANERLNSLYMVHGRNQQSREAARLLTSLDFRSAQYAQKDRGFAPVSLTQVYRPIDPKNPDKQAHVGWIQQLESSNGYRISRFYDRNWRPVGFISLDGTLEMVGQEQPVTRTSDAELSLIEASEIVFNSPAYFGYDSELYDRTTLLRQSRDWASLNPDQRGMRLVTNAREVTLRELTGRELSLVQRDLEKDTFYRNEITRQEAIRLDRAGGELSDYERRGGLGAPDTGR